MPSPNLEFDQFVERVGLTGRYQPKADHAVLQTLAIIVAIGGLVQDSPAVVIGAMLLAPLMNPVLAFSASITMGRSTDTARLAVWISVLVLGSVGLSAGLGLLLPDVTLTDELLSRTSPDLRDLVVAIAAGTAGAYALTRSDRSAALPGVAVAVALVPPMAAAGLSLAAGRPSLARGASLLLATNLAAIVLMGIVTFVVTGAVDRRQVRAHLRSVLSSVAAFAGALALIAIPLGGRSFEAFATTQRQSSLEVEVRDWLGSSATTVSDVSLVDRRLIVRLAGPSEPPPPEPLETAVEALLGRDIDLDLRWLQEIAGTSEGTIPLTSNELNGLATDWLAASGPPDARVTRLLARDAVIEITIEGSAPPPDSVLLADRIEALTDVRPQINVEWRQEVGAAELMTTTSIESLLRAHLRAASPETTLVSAWREESQVTAIIVSGGDDAPSEADAAAALEDAGVELAVEFVALDRDDASLTPLPAEPAPEALTPAADAPAVVALRASIEDFNDGDPSSLVDLFSRSDEFSQVVTVHAVFDRPMTEAVTSFILIQERSAGSLRLRRVTEDPDRQRFTTQPLEPQALDLRDPRAVVAAQLEFNANRMDLTASSLTHPASGEGVFSPFASLIRPRALDFGATRFTIDQRQRTATVPVLVELPGEEARVRCDVANLRTLGQTDAWLVESVVRGEPLSRVPGAVQHGQYC